MSVGAVSMGTTVSTDTQSPVKLDIGLSRAIKGFAIILMVAHHCFGFPEWYIQGVDYSKILILGTPLASWVTESTHLCVSLFAFLTGWAYFFNKKPTLSYSVGKIVNFLKYYWFVLFLVFVPAGALFAHYTPTVKELILNMFAVKTNYVSFAWYVYFYIFVMLTLPFVAKIFNGKPLFDFFFAIAACAVVYDLVSRVVIFRDYISGGLLNCLTWYPCVLVGYLAAKHDLLTRLHKVFGHPNKILYACTLLVIMGCRIKWQSLLTVSLDVLYAPAAVYCLVMLLTPGAAAVRKPLEFLGNQAMNIWFLHSIFFSVILRPYFQRIAFLPKNPILVVIWVILLCLPLSILINFVFRQQERLFRAVKAKYRRKPDS
jgi:hypothetical protein